MNHTIKAQIGPRQIIDAAIALELVRKNGFPKAQIIYWDQDNPEYGYESLTEMLDGAGSATVTIGIQLNADPMIANREWNEDADELGPVELLTN